MSSDPATTLWEALERAGCEPMGAPPSFRAKCPGHGGENPTALRVGIGADGRALIHCFRGCSAERVLAPLGLSTIDLYPIELRHRGGRRDLVLAPGRGRRTADVLLEASRELGLGYRCTRNPEMWVAELCPVCQLAPLIVHEEDAYHDRDRPGRISLWCLNGCDPVVILHALLGVK